MGKNDDTMSVQPASPGAAPSAALMALVRTPSRVARELEATVGVDLEGERWTIHFERGRVFIEPGTDGGVDTQIATDAATLSRVTEGRESGVKAFLDGRLRVRGNLALSLRLDGLFEHPPRPARFPRAATVQAGRIRTFFLEAGKGSPVVLLHGLGATTASLLPTLWDLSRDHRVLVPDLPGFGDTDKPIRRYDSAFFVRWLAHFMEETGVDRADLVGNSMGGRVAIEMGLRHPDRVGRVVLLTPSPAFIRRRQFVRVVQILRPELALLPSPVPHAMVVRGIKRMFAHPERLDEAWYLAAADEFLRIFSTARGRIAFFSAARQIYLEEPFGEEGFWDRLPDLRRPALFLWGARDRLVPAKFARHVERALPAATSVILEDCGHVPQYEVPERTHRLIREFLS